MDSDESKKFLFTQPKATITIPFELSRNGFFFTMRVNDGGPLWFTLDSGSAANYLGMDQAEKLGLEFHGTKTVHAAGGQSTKVHIADGISFALPGLVSKEHQIHAASLPGLSQWGRSVDGLLGYNFLERFTVTIDYDAKQLTIMEPSRFNYTGPGEILPIQFDRDQPYVRAMIKVPGKTPRRITLPHRHRITRRSRPSTHRERNRENLRQSRNTPTRKDPTTRSSRSKHRRRTIQSSDRWRSTPPFQSNLRLYTQKNDTRDYTRVLAAGSLLRLTTRRTSLRSNRNLRTAMNTILEKTWRRRVRLAHGRNGDL